MTPFQSDKHMTQVRKIHPAVWALGFVSLFMDISSEIIHSLLPVFLISVIGASVQTVGLIEGVAEATARVTRIFSGSLSDWLGKCKLLAIVGYGLGALSKPFFALASCYATIFQHVLSTGSAKGSVTHELMIIVDHNHQIDTVLLLIARQNILQLSGQVHLRSYGSKRS